MAKRKRAKRQPIDRSPWNPSGVGAIGYTRNGEAAMIHRLRLGHDGSLIGRAHCGDERAATFDGAMTLRLAAWLAGHFGYTLVRLPDKPKRRK